ncbi:MULTISPECIES: hypothetical protein [unclassified Streptomyces]|uniref:hypothetical protein n=1 Tax=unclassified Streptomyces TaxID=2593676 RepID=UPI00340FDF31
MVSDFGPQYAPAGDVGAALMVVDSRLRSIHGHGGRSDPEEQALAEQFLDSMGPQSARDLLDGACTLVYMFMTWLRKAHESHGKDVIEYVVPNLVASMSAMRKSVRPEAIPTLAGLVIAAGTGLSPSLWREQYGDWTEAEMNALEVTAFLLAEHINRITEDPDFATRLISEALARTEES